MSIVIPHISQLFDGYEKSQSSLVSRYIDEVFDRIDNIKTTSISRTDMIERSVRLSHETGISVSRIQRALGI